MIVNKTSYECVTYLRMQRVESDRCLTDSAASSDAIQLPQLRRHSQSLTTLSRPSRLAALTRAITPKHKWRFSLVVSPPPPSLPTPSTAPALPPSSSPSLVTSQPGDDGEQLSRVRSRVVNF